MRYRKSQKRKKTAFRKTLKKQNCSPAVKGKTPLDHTCFTTEALEELKKAYNAHHTSNPINTNDPKKIWKTLSVKLSHCDKESCWLNQIKDKNLREKMESDLFAPAQPKMWKKNPNEWLSNFDILKVLKQYEATYPEFLFIGPTPIDFDTLLPENNNTCVWKDLCSFSLSEQITNGQKKIGALGSSLS